MKWSESSCSHFSPLRFKSQIASLKSLFLHQGTQTHSLFSLSLSLSLSQGTQTHSFSKMILNLWKWYQNALATHPVRTQVISSGVLWGLGDVAAQSISYSRMKKKKNPEDGEVEPFKVNWQRAATTSVFGFAFIGPVGHFWYQGLDQLIAGRFKMQPKSLPFVSSKLALDGFIFGPIYIISYFTYMGLSAGKSWTQVKEDAKRDLMPALAVGIIAGPILQIINFRYVPVKYQLLYVNMYCLFDSAFMSWVEQEEDAPWKKWFTSLLEGKKEKKI